MTTRARELGQKGLADDERGILERALHSGTPFAQVVHAAVYGHAGCRLHEEERLQRALTKERAE